MKAKKNIIISCIICFCLGLRFFFGVYEDDEFGDDVYFIKYKPTWKWRFHSPRGMSDLNTNQMTDENKYEQMMFDEYLKGRK